MHIREMTIQDYDAVIALWQSVIGMGLSDSDSREGIGRYLARNPGMSFAAWDGDLLVGAVLCGHDGRRESRSGTDGRGRREHHRRR